MGATTTQVAVLDWGGTLDDLEVKAAGGPVSLLSGSMSTMIRPTEEQDLVRTLEGRMLEAGEIEKRWSSSEGDAPARPFDREGDGTRLAVDERNGPSGNRT